MRRSATIVAAVAVGIAGLAGGFWLQHATRSPAPLPPDAAATPEAATIKGRARPAFSLRDLNGKQQDVAQWDNHVVLLNFWATWCPPCRREIPALIELQNKFGRQGLQVVGVAIDQPHLVEEFRDTAEMNYPVLVGESDALAVSKSYGNVYGQLPYSVIIARDGTIREVHRGELTTAAAESLLKPLLSR